ncbi:MAG TPA: hypothetical protein VKU00_13740 [Chthonomonadaceae bacterium]|nr:hypothetical protein [Chthonomonadaceae bacterium]
MPNHFVPAIVGLAILLPILGSVGYLLDHPPLLIGLLVVIGCIAYLWQRHSRARNRV